jgi:small subunit ribosomal protein S7
MRRKVKKRIMAKPDYKFGSFDVEKFTNYVMHDGKKSVARKVVYSALEVASKQSKKDPLEIFEEAVKNATPLWEVRSRRVGGANYQVPREVPADRGKSLAMRWIIQAARSKKGKAMHRRLSEELVLAAKNEGDAIKKKQTTHKMAESNKAFAHFAW